MPEEYSQTPEESCQTSEEYYQTSEENCQKSGESYPTREENVDFRGVFDKKIGAI